MGLVVPNPATLVALGDLHDPKVLMGILGFFIIVVLAAKGIHSGVLISIVIVTALALAFDPAVSFKRHNVYATKPWAVVGRLILPVLLMLPYSG
ncbi:Probable adenine permease PurP [Mannheimia haemolytica]|uniref:Probable adenine permease PurP n=1 Tax=Mannheimia haemolytica TaxID=75985 RepID=A0A378NBJ4_MANHA|nr:Probable adenine permease PurP [Mannheimia haemolytica]